MEKDPLGGSRRGANDYKLFMVSLERDCPGNLVFTLVFLWLLWVATKDGTSVAAATLGERSVCPKAFRYKGRWLQIDCRLQNGKAHCRFGLHREPRVNNTSHIALA